MKCHDCPYAADPDVTPRAVCCGDQSTDTAIFTYNRPAPKYANRKARLTAYAKARRK